MAFTLALYTSQRVSDLVRMGWQHVKGDRIAVLSNGRGIGEVAGDLVLREGGKLAQLADATLTALDAVLPPTWGRRGARVRGALQAGRDPLQLLAARARRSVPSTLRRSPGRAP